LARYHLSRFKWPEPILLLGGVAILLLTYSRSGLAVTVGAAVLTFLVAGSGVMKDLWSWYRAGFRRGAKMQVPASRIMITLILIGAIIASGVFLSDKGYIAALWNSSAESLWDYAIDAYLGPRLAYVIAGLSSFQSHPLTGVGLGASGFNMYAHMPDWALSGVPEIARQLSPSSNLYPNPKNFYVRLLAETGLPGFILYVSILFTMLAYALKGLRRVEPFWRFIGTAGFFSVMAIAAQGISQDSFAMPEMWVNLGMLAGVVAFGLESEKSLIPSPLPQEER